MSDFWSRRRAQVAAEERAEAEVLEQAALAEREAALEEKSDAELLAELDLPDPDTLTEGDDFKAFLSDAVPARLRTRALRRLWRVNPIFGSLDGLVDYGEDYTDAAMVVENMQTVYQVGKGMLARFEEEAEEQAVEGREEPLAATEPQEPEPDTEQDAEPDTEIGASVDETAQITAQAEVPDQIRDAPAFVEDDTDIPMARPTRRMRFSFDEAGA